MKNKELTLTQLLVVVVLVGTLVAIMLPKLARTTQASKKAQTEDVATVTQSEQEVSETMPLEDMTPSTDVAQEVPETTSMEGVAPLVDVKQETLEITQSEETAPDVTEQETLTQAETVMRAVRTEQEARCAADKQYTQDSGDLTSWPAQQGPHFTYTLGETGMIAENLNESYKLEMPTYTDGRICCTPLDVAEAACAKLAEQYPGCPLADLVQAPSACSAVNLVPHAEGL